MGYTSTIEGEFAIEPPLTYSEMQQLNFLTKSQARSIGASICVHVDKREVETQEGILTKTEGVAIGDAWGGEAVKRYDIVNEIQSIINAFPGHEFSGCIEGFGEETGDLWRLYVVDRKVKRVEPQIVWPKP